MDSQLNLPHRTKKTEGSNKTENKKIKMLRSNGLVIKSMEWTGRKSMVGEICERGRF